MVDSTTLPLIPALCALARSAGFVTAGSWPLLPGACPRVRLAATFALTAACLPHAAAASDRSTPLAALPLELLLGAALGGCVAAVSAAVSWAISFAQAALGDDGQPTEFTTEPDPLDPLVGSCGAMGRLAFWMGTAAFFGAGGERWLVGGFIGSYHTMPPGHWHTGDLASLAAELAASGFGLAVSLAIPLLAAVVTFRLSTALVLRTSSLSLGPGLLRAASTLMLLAVLWIAGDLWAGRLGHALEGPLDRAFGVVSTEHSNRRFDGDAP